MTVKTAVKEIESKRDLDKNICILNEVNSSDKALSTNEVEYDDLLSSAGEFGKYQLLLFFSTFPFCIFGVFVYYSQLFMTEVSPNHWCWIPELGNLTEIERRNLAIPADDTSRFGYDQCRAFDANWTEVLINGVRPNASWTTIPCQHGWEFNKSEIPYPTISSELEWVCQKDNYQANAQALFFLGSVFGGFIIGYISDRFGRLPAAVVSSLIGGVMGAISTYSRNFIEFAICRFFMGMSYDNCMMMTYLLVLEYIAPRYRTLISNMSFALFYALGVTALPWIALACGHWKVISLVTSLPLGLAILAPFLIPESPRWLLSKGRVEEAVAKILTIGRINKKEVPPKLIEKFKLTLSYRKQEETASPIELLRRPKLRKMFIAICFVYMCCTIVFDGLVRSIGQLDFDFFVSFSVVSFTEFPSLVIVAFIMDWTGRKWLTTIVMTISCIFSILTVFIGGGFLSVMCAVVARFAVNMAYNTSMQWAAEMLPVSVRGSGVSIVHICGYISTMISPYIVYLETYIYWIPLVIVGCIAGLGGLTALTLPETAGKDMPQTFANAEELMTKGNFWEMPCMRKKKQNIKSEPDCLHI